MIDYVEDIAKALDTPGGHLAIGRGGFCLHYEDRRLAGDDCDIIKRQAIDAGLPVIDSRLVPFALAARLAITGPMIAVNRSGSPGCWHNSFEAPLAMVAASYRHVGAEIHNLDDDPAIAAWFARRCHAPLDLLLDDWITHILRSVMAESLVTEEFEQT